MRFTHGMTDTSEYTAWRSARARCNNPKHVFYPEYGGRGIKFCFDSFESFFAEVGKKPTPSHSLDRIDNDGNYEVGNVKWSTQSEQVRNQRCDNCVRLKVRIAELEKALQEKEKP